MMNCETRSSKSALVDSVVDDRQELVGLPPQRPPVRHAVHRRVASRTGSHRCVPSLGDRAFRTLSMPGTSWTLEPLSVQAPTSLASGVDTVHTNTGFSFGCRAVSCGGNMLLNVGPTADGRIAPIFEERLRDVGRWLAVNGGAVYGSRPWTFQNETSAGGGDVWYTRSGEDRPRGQLVYAILLSWPATGVVQLAAPAASPDTTVLLLGHDQPLDVNETPTASFSSIWFDPISCWLVFLASLRAVERGGGGRHPSGPAGTVGRGRPQLGLGPPVGSRDQLKPDRDHRSAFHHQCIRKKKKNEQNKTTKQGKLVFRRVLVLVLPSFTGLSIQTCSAKVRREVKLG